MTTASRCLFAFAFASAPTLAAQELVPLHTFDGAAGNEVLGSSVCVGPDLTGDGKGEVLIGVPNAIENGLYVAGRVEVRNGATGAVLYACQGEVTLRHLGFRVATSPDLDGDGVPDLLLAGNGSATALAGSVRVASGATGAPIRTVTGTSPGEQFGDALACIGDVDGDGSADFAVGAPGEWMHGIGSVRVYSGANGTMIRSYSGGGSGDNLGFAVAGIGDVTLDGVPDFAMGAPGDNVSDFGEIWIASGSSGEIVRETDGVVPSGLLGFSIAGLGPIDLDGIPDYVVGAPGVKNGAGSAIAFSGKTGKPLKTVKPPAAVESVGSAVAGIGDVTGDGVGDFAVGAPSAEPGGAVRVYSGASGKLIGSCAGATAGEHFGYAVAAGDVNGDGLPDLAVGAWGADPGAHPNAGQATVYSLVELIGLGGQGTKKAVMALQRHAAQPDADAFGKIELSAQGDLFKFVVDVQKLDAPPVGSAYHVFLETAPESDAYTEIALLVASGKGKWKVLLSSDGSAPSVLGVLVFAPLAGRRVEIRDDTGIVYLACVLPPLFGVPNLHVKIPLAPVNAAAGSGQLSLTFNAATGVSVFDLATKSLETEVVYSGGSRRRP
ncbi:MAG TPA: hypothetical protein VKE69_07955, partial [Planctomycetota bacterium]|nr:hypothetical protein [Planctomycetota bacterium]